MAKYKFDDLNSLGANKGIEKKSEFCLLSPKITDQENVLFASGYKNFGWLCGFTFWMKPSIDIEIEGDDGKKEKIKRDFPNKRFSIVYKLPPVQMSKYRRNAGKKQEDTVSEDDNKSGGFSVETNPKWVCMVYDDPKQVKFKIVPPIALRQMFGFSYKAFRNSDYFEESVAEFKKMINGFFNGKREGKGGASNVILNKFIQANDTKNFQFYTYMFELIQKYAQQMENAQTQMEDVNNVKQYRTWIDGDTATDTEIEDKKLNDEIKLAAAVARGEVKLGTKEGFAKSQKEYRAQLDKLRKTAGIDYPLSMRHYPGMFN